jgi:glutamate racemase
MEKVRIGVFDSGVGGLSVLRAIHTLSPLADLHYVADSAHAPYGERDDDFIADRALRLGRYLRDRGVSVIVVACNTATAVAVGALRSALAPLPIVGVEPGLKPALAATRHGRIAVLATAATLRSDRFRKLVERLSPGSPLHLQACHGLAAALEAGDLASAELRDLVERHCAPVRAFGADTVVLGCTHYPFARRMIEASLPGVTIIDTSDAVARRVFDVCGAPAGAMDSPRVLLETTGDVTALGRVATAWLPFAVELGAVPQDVEAGTRTL